MFNNNQIDFIANVGKLVVESRNLPREEKENQKDYIDIGAEALKILNNIQWEKAKRACFDRICIAAAKHGVQKVETFVQNGCVYFNIYGGDKAAFARDTDIILLSDNLPAAPSQPAEVIYSRE